MRECGMLLPIASLPSKYGIGAFDKKAYQWIDQLVEMKQSYWQILPLGPTGYGDSPYQSFSTYAGNPYFIDLDDFIEKKWLTHEECRQLEQEKIEKIDYEQIYKTRFQVLFQAFKRSEITKQQAFVQFCKEQNDWLDDYALFMTIKELHDGQSFTLWEENLRNHDETAIRLLREKERERYDFYCFVQYEFFEQWFQLKQYANDAGIQIIGDVPIYVAFDSADVWAHPELFQMNEKGLPTNVAGCPPDGFSATGQLWGNPLYRWEYHKKTNFKWWINRINHLSKLYDITRIDHFRGFDEYYSIPYGDQDAKNGHWEKGPGMDLFKALKEQLGEIKIIAEDLGFLTDSVRKLLKDSGFPGMKVLQFAYDSRESGDYDPVNYEENSIVYTGTHDNSTLLGFLSAMSKEDLCQMCNKLHISMNNQKEILWRLIETALTCKSKICIIPVQDYLELDDQDRINIPSTMGSNWCFRMKKGAFSKKRKEKIAQMVISTGRTKKLL